MGRVRKVMPNLVNLKYQRFGRLFVVDRVIDYERLIKTKRPGNTYWLCRCECGKYVSVRSSSLRSGATKSCGCLKEEQNKLNLKALSDLTGKKFNRITVINGTDKRDAAGCAMWVCECSCGSKDLLISGSSLRLGKTKSCGCYNYEVITKHGHCPKTKPSPTYSTYTSMLTRCYGRSKNGETYQIANIQVCDRWKESFKNFLEDMGERPENTTLDRIDPWGNYEPSNCRWATIQEQNRNKREKVFPKTFLQELEELGLLNCKAEEALQIYENSKPAKSF